MKKSFTLIELLVVIAIIGLLVIIIAIPINRARQGASIARILQYEASLHRYLGSDIVGWWQFNEGEGSVAYDISGHNNHGTLVNNPQWVDGVPGKGGSALEFNGQNNQVKISDPIGELREITISLWVKFFNLDSYQHIFEQDTNRTRLFWNWGSQPNKFYIVFSNGISAHGGYTDTQIIEKNKWYNIIAKSNGSDISLYLNGEEIYKVTRTDHIINGNNSDFRIGSRSENVTSPFNGLIDDARIYSRALTSEEIQTIYTETKDKYLTEEL